MQRLRLLRHLLLAAIGTAWATLPAGAFVTRLPLSSTARWSAEPYRGTGLHDGIQVGVSAGIEAAFGLTPDEIPPFRQAVRDAFAAWENEVLRFQVSFDAATVRGTEPGEGFEIDVFAVPGSDPELAIAEFYGLAALSTDFTPDRLLTNGQRTDGETITGGDIYLNLDTILFFRNGFALTEEQQAAALQRLLMHEIGHLLALDHPNSGTYLDTDTDPSNPIRVDPCDIEAGLLISPNFDNDAVMSNATSGLTPLLRTSLGPDELGARDVLYPAPPPGLVCEPFPPGADDSPPGRLLVDARDEPALGSIRALAVDRAGNLLVLHADGLIRIDAAGSREVVIDAAVAGATLGGPLALAVGPDGTLFVTGRDDNAVRLDPDGSFREIIDASGDGLGNLLDFADSIALDAAGNVFVASRNNHQVFRVDPTGAIERVIGPEGAGPDAPLTAPGKMVVDRQGNLYVAGILSNNLLKWSPDGRIVELIERSGIGDAGFFRPEGLAVDAEDHVLALSNQFVVFRVAPDESVAIQTDFRPGLSRPWLPSGLVLDALGNVSAFDQAGDAAYRATSAGEVETLFEIETHALGPSRLILAMAAGSRGTLYFGERVGGRHRVFAVDPACRAGLDVEPSIGSVLPETPAAGQLALLEGAGFQPASQVFFGERPLGPPWSFVSDSQLVVELPRDLAGEGELRIVNPAVCDSEPVKVDVAALPDCGPLGLEPLAALLVLAWPRRRRG